MILRRLHARNFRAFADLELGFEPGFNLLIGDNQAGKTAVLDAIAIGLSAFFQGFRTGTALGIDRSDVRLALHKLGEQVQMPAQYPVELEWLGTFDEQEIRWQRGLQGPSRRTSKTWTPLGELGMALDRKMQRGETFDLPVIAYFGTERIARHRRTRPDTAERIKDRSLGYKDCLERASNLPLIRKWMLQRSLARAQKQARGLPVEAETAALQAIEAAVRACAPEVNAFYYSHDFEDLAVTFHDGRILPWSMQSDGVRSLVTLAMDLAWRSVVLNPHRGAAAATDTMGVVLIDEVDLALHPEWQRGVVTGLRRAFPRLQFIATTHSPQVITSAQDTNVLKLTAGAAYRVERSYGMESNAVLTDIMHTTERPREIHEALQRVARLIDEEAFAEARQEIGRLEQILAVDDTGLVQLRTALWFAEPQPAEPVLS